MIRLCEPEVCTLNVRRLSAEEFCTVAQTEAGSLYRPHSEVLRMLAVGQALGLCRGREPLTALLALPMAADLSAAAGLRRVCGTLPRQRGWLLTPPVGQADPQQTAFLLQAGLSLLRRRAPTAAVWAALEYGAAERLVPVYIQNGFALRALRPLQSLAPCYLFSAGPYTEAGHGSWLPLHDPAGLAIGLTAGRAAVESRCAAGGCELRLAPIQL